MSQQSTTNQNLPASPVASKEYEWGVREERRRVLEGVKKAFMEMAREYNLNALDMNPRLVLNCQEFWMILEKKLKE